MTPPTAGTAPPPASPDAREAERQRDLLRAINGRPGIAVAGLLALPRGRRGDASPEAGLSAYRANARAHARRALAAACPTLRQLVGEEGFGALAAAFWQARPPVRGDLAHFGEGLGDWLVEVGAFPGEPYLPDVARLDWAVHRAGFAADQEAAVAGLVLLGEADPDMLWVRLVPGTAVLASAYPVVSLWQAHRGEAEAGPEAREQGFADARAALAAGCGERALVWRRGWGVEVGRLDAAEAAFTRRLMAGDSLGRALAAVAPVDGPASTSFDFERWLLRALREGWLARFERLPAGGANGADAAAAARPAATAGADEPADRPAASPPIRSAAG